MLRTIGKSTASAVLGLVCLGLLMEAWQFAHARSH
jgi:hypothetical protein